MLEDLAVLTGGSAILEDGPIQLDQVGSSPFRYLGKVGKVTISKDDTLLLMEKEKARCKGKKK